MRHPIVQRIVDAYAAQEAKKPPPKTPAAKLKHPRVTPKVDNLDLQLASSATNLPTLDEFKTWLSLAIPSEQQQWDITLRVVDEAESQSLNRDYRGKDYPTNVLSFPADVPAELNIPLLGDLVICAPVVAREACEQGKPWQPIGRTCAFTALYIY